MQRYACIAPENRKMYILQDALVAFLGLMLVVDMWYVLYYWDYDLQWSLKDFGYVLISVLNLPLLEIFDIVLFGHDHELLANAGVLAVILYMLIIAAAVFAIVDLRRHLAARKYIAQHGAVEAPSVQQQYLWRFNRYEEQRIRMKKDGLLPYVIVFALLLYFNISLAIIGYSYFDSLVDFVMLMFGLLLDALFVVCVLRRRVRKMRARRITGCRCTARRRKQRFLFCSAGSPQENRAAESPRPCFFGFAQITACRFRRRRSSF